MRQIRVLLVDDHDFTRTTVAAALREVNVSVVVAVPSARDAMIAVREHPVDCAVLDLNLGLGPTGLDLAYRLREHDPRIGIVLMSGYRDRRMMSDDPRPLPRGAHYVVKDDIRSTAHLREAIDIALGNVEAATRPASGTLPLTDTQMEIVRMVASGLTNAEIARRRGVSERSVQTALGRILDRLNIESTPGVNSRVQLIRVYDSMRGLPHAL